MSLTTPKPTAEQLSLAADLLHYAAQQRLDAKCIERLRIEIAREDADGVADEIANTKAALGWNCCAIGCSEELDYDTRDGKPLSHYCSRQCAQTDPDFWGGL